MRYLVVGLGKTGVSLIRYLRSQGHSVVAFDTREAASLTAEMAREFPDLPCFFGDFPTDVRASVEAIAVSPGVDPAWPVIAELLAEAKARSLTVTSDIQLFLDRVRETAARVIGITGSNGKSTVSALTFEMLKASGKSARLGGNFGTPALELLANDVEFYVLELSSFQLEWLSHPPALDVSVVLNVSPNHLDRHRTLENYRAFKARIHGGSRAPLSPGQGFSLQRHHGERWIFSGTQPLMRASDVRLLGEHNLHNALSALALVYAALKLEEASDLNAALAPSLEVLRTFAGLPHRCQRVAEVGGVTWVNDSKSTTGASVEAALQGLGPDVLARGGKILLLAGGQAKGATFESLRDSVSRYVGALIVFGQDAPQWERDLSGIVPLHRVETLPQAVAWAEKKAHPGDVVLLSPGCASLDQFKSFEHRGAVFEQEVRARLHDV